MDKKTYERLQRLYYGVLWMMLGVTLYIGWEFFVWRL